MEQIVEKLQADQALRVADPKSVANELAEALKMTEALDSLDLSSYEPISSVISGSATLREDEPAQSDVRKNLISPSIENDHFVVPRVVG